MKSLVKGQNIALDAELDASRSLQVGLGWRAGDASAPTDLDVWALLLDSASQSPSAASVVYYQQLSAAGGAVTLSGDDRTGRSGGDGGDAERVDVRLDALPPEVARIAFVVALHADAGSTADLGAVRGGHIRLSTPGAEIVRFDLDEVAGGERAMVFGELYLHTSGWKFRAVGQGYAEGLVAVARQYGVDLSALDLTKTPAAIPAPAPAPPAPASTATANPNKVVLTKSAPRVSLTKKGTPSGSMRVNLNWIARPPAQGGGLLKRVQASTAQAVDLDLGCLYELSDGSKGVVQALGNMFQSRSKHERPIVWLDGDDRSGGNAGGENLHIDLSAAPDIRRLLVFAFIYQGVPNWSAANAVVTLFPSSGPQVEIALDEPDPKAPTCAIALLENVGGEIEVRREVRYIQGTQSALDSAYGWGMNWSRGRK